MLLKSAWHAYRLQGALTSHDGSEPMAAPAVLPWFTHHRFSFVSSAAAPQQVEWSAGAGGATLLVCDGDRPA